MSGRPRALLIAESANPEQVSVPLVGWSVAKALFEVADCHLVTQIRNRDALTRAGWVEGREFTCIDTEDIALPAYRLAGLFRRGGGGWTILAAINAFAYPVFERRVWRRFGAAIEGGEYDVVHRITPLTPSARSSIAPKCRAAGVPFVLGPLNGGVPWPKGFEAVRKAEGEFMSRFRSAYRWLPGSGATFDAASAILAGARVMEAELARWGEKTIHLPENAIDLDRFPLRAPRPPGDPLRAAFVGRLAPLKGLDMLIEAAGPLMHEGRLTLDIVGDGQMMAALRTQAAPFGEAVRFHGWLDHAGVAAVLAEADLFAFPSIREFGGGAVLEAMAAGVPPLVVDYAGPGELVTADTGFKAAIGTPEDTTANLRTALEEVAQAPERLAEIGARAHARVADHFTWKRKAAQIAEIYDWVLGKRAEKPRPIPA